MLSHILLVKLGMLSCLLTLAGVFLLIVWAMKNLSKNQLKHASLWLIGLGIGLGILTSSGGFGMMGGYGMMGGGKWMMDGNMYYNRAMMDAMKSRGMNMDEDEFEDMMEDARDLMEEGGMMRGGMMR